MFGVGLWVVFFFFDVVVDFVVFIFVVEGVDGVDEFVVEFIVCSICFFVVVVVVIVIVVVVWIVVVCCVGGYLGDLG